MPPTSPQFASDNWAGAHPAVLAALAEANVGHHPAYGADPWTARAVERIRALVEAPAAEVFLVWGGTGANVVALASLLQPWESVLCADVAHINVDECGAPERFLSAKLADLPSVDGKLVPDVVRERLTGFGVEHHVQPGVLSLTQSTEYGTVYTPDELRALTSLAKAHGLRVHLDGARLANAAATLGLPVAAFTRDVGIDVLVLGGTKNGLIGAEAIVVFDPARAGTMKYLRKQAMQLASKQRYLGAQFCAILEDDRWLANARHANAMACRLAEGVRGVPGVRLTRAVQANAVFAIVPPAHVAALQAHAMFYVWNEATGEVRWMTSWDTAPEDVDAFTARVRAVCGA